MGLPTFIFKDHEATKAWVDVVVSLGFEVLRVPELCAQRTAEDGISHIEEEAFYVRSADSEIPVLQVKITRTEGGIKRALVFPPTQLGKKSRQLQRQVISKLTEAGFERRT